MRKIERGLYKIHQFDGAGGSQSDNPSISTSNLQEGNFLLEPFLRINEVTPGSPAELAVSK